MLSASAASPAAIVIDVPSTTRGPARPLTDRDGAVVAWATRRDGNAVLITLPGGDARDVGYTMVHSGRVTQLVRGSQPDVVLQRVTAGSTVIEGRHDNGPAVHVARPEMILPAH